MSSSSNMISQQWFEFQMMKMKLKMMKLEVQKLTDQKELTERDISVQSLTSNESSASIYWWDKIDIFHKYIAFKASRLAFKLKEQSNYNNWQNKALTQTHFIEVKMILKNRQRSLLTNLFNDDLEIWHLKNTAVYDMLMTELKSDIHQNIKLQIDDNEKNMMKLWIALEAEYRVHASNLRLKLFNKLSSISMNIYDTNIWDYIADFYDILEKLKTMKYKLNK